MYIKFDPYEINVNTVKGYFKKKRVLAPGILLILNSIAFIVIAIMTDVSHNESVLQAKENSSGNALERLLSGMGEAISALIAGVIIAGCVFAVLFSLLAAVSYISLNGSSRSEKRTPRGAATYFFVVSIIKLFFLGTVLSGIIQTAAGNIRYELSRGMEPFAPGGKYDYKFWLFAAFLVFAVIHSIVQVFYSYSIGKSMRSVELKTRGAKAYGILSIILALFFAANIIMTVIDVIRDQGALAADPVFNIASYIPLVIMTVTLILQASVALGYRKYIDGVRSGYNGAEYKGLETPAPVRRPEPVKPEKKTNDVDLKKNPYADLFDSSTDNKADKESFDDLFGEPEKKEKAGASAPVCPKCGNEIPAGSAFCNHCGAKM